MTVTATMAGGTEGANRKTKRRTAHAEVDDGDSDTEMACDTSALVAAATAPARAGATSTVPPIEYECEGLAQRVRYRYTTDETGRRTVSTSGTAWCDIRLQLPLCATPAMWQRHNMSLTDVIDVLNTLNIIHLWRLAVLLGFTPPMSSLKPGFATPVAMFFVSKNSVLVRVSGCLLRNFPWLGNESTPSALDKSRRRHVPPCPVHRIPMHEYQTWRDSVRPWKRLSENTDVDDAAFYTWRDITLVALSVEDDAIHAARVVSAAVYHASGRARELQALITRPFVFRRTDGSVWYGLLDEAVFFLPG